MYNYVCATFTFTKDGELNPYAIKVGVTSNCNQRFPQICKEIEKEEFPFGTGYAAVLPLFIVGGDYDKYMGERIEDILRLYYLRKLGFDRGYKQDWITAEDLSTEYDIEAEGAELEAMLTEWLPKNSFHIYHKYTAEMNISEQIQFGSMYGRFTYKYRD